VEVTGLPVTDDDVTITCTDTNGDCSAQEGQVTIAVSYVRHMPLPWWKGKFITLHFHPSATETLLPANWN
jgi:hypothetical protein